MTTEIFIASTTFITLAITTIGAAYIFAKDIKTEIKTDMQEINLRWANLFEKFHILDKDMEKFRIPSKRKTKPNE